MTMLPMDPERMPLNFDPSLMQAPKIKKRGGMFGGGAARGIAGSIGDYLLQMNGMQPMYAPAMQEQQRMRYLQEQYQQRRGDERDDFLWKQEHTPPQPTQTDRYLGEIMDPNVDPERKKMLSQVLFPPVMGVVNGVPSMIDRASMFGGAGNPQDAQPTVEDGFAYTPGPGGRANQSNWKQQGGPGPLGVRAPF